eukprot:CAMPEP_0119131812 /NCGR_PEP_ID=MMETSP1310-20130426/10663_1 /TAXON_ID=464262 /ORGANISM="Genus nov. species nov., Strain RCC2339" /LENGTH=216 /DNA_ID=CAMNT_0007122407 /DNA_START=94 /DNA_END=744 /DNA_ORIENTATION=+
MANQIGVLKGGEHVRLISNKVPNQANPRDCVTIRQNGDVVSCGRPSNDHSLREFVVHVHKDGVRFENVQVGGFLSCDPKTLKVFVGTPASEQDSCWQLFNTGNQRDTIPATSLEDVWIQSVATNGFLSVRDAEGWTFDGCIWTRDENGNPAGAYSWECFDVQVLGASAKAASDDANVLKKQLVDAQAELARLRQENAELRQYKDLVVSFKNAMDKV